MRNRRGISPLLPGDLHVVEAGRGDDDAIANAASRQHGIVTRAQLLSLGLTRHAIDHRLSAGRLRPLFPGVYAAGHDAITFSGRALGAVASVSPGAAVSHLSSIALWRLIDPLPGVVHVTTLQSRRSRAGIALHRGGLPAAELAYVDGVPATSLPRTFLDLSASLPERRLRRLIKDAEFRELVRIPDLVWILDRYPRRRGRRTLASLVAPLLAHRGLSRSGLEDDFLAFCAARGLPMPETNRRLTIAGRNYEPDAMWPESGVIVELDGRDAHARELAFEDDRARDRSLIAAGWVPMRVTSAQLGSDPDLLEAQIQQAIRRRSGTGVDFARQDRA